MLLLLAHYSLLLLLPGCCHDGRGLGVNPPPVNPMAPYMPWINLLIFIIFCFKGIDPIFKFFAERKQVWKQVGESAACTTLGLRGGGQRHACSRLVC